MSGILSVLSGNCSLFARPFKGLVFNQLTVSGHRLLKPLCPARTLVHIRQTFIKQIKIVILGSQSWSEQPWSWTQSQDPDGEIEKFGRNVKNSIYTYFSQFFTIAYLLSPNRCHWQIAKVKNYNLNVTEVRDSDFKNAFPRIFNFTVGILKTTQRRYNFERLLRITCIQLLSDAFWHISETSPKMICHIFGCHSIQ